MKKQIFFMFILISLIFTGSCQKEETEEKECEKYKTGTITISNSSSNPYSIYIDGVYKMQLSGGSISTPITISEGNNRKMYAEQVSGYLIYPTTKTTYFNVVRCSDYSWQIP